MKIKLLAISKDSCYNVGCMKATRINIIGVGVDVIAPEDIEDAIMELCEKPGTKHVVFLSVWDLLRARHRGDFHEFIKAADLVIPISRSILKGAAKLKRATPYRYNPFTLIINIMTILDNHYKSIFLFGSRPQTLHVARKNVATTFPNLKIFGTHPGYYKRSKEGDIIKAIYKSSPSLVLCSEGIIDGTLWAYKRRNDFQSSIFIYYADALGIFAKRVRKTSEKTFEKGGEIWYELLRNPLRIFRIFPYIHYKMALLVMRISEKRAAKKARKLAEKERLAKEAAEKSNPTP